MHKPLTERAPASLLTGATPGVAGHIADSPVVELLGYAYNRRFEGQLELRCDTGEQLRVAFLGGRVDGVVAPSLAEASQRNVLESHLPPETLQFAQEHARIQGGDLLAAVEALHLLPPETRHLVRAECVTSQIIALCRLRGDTGYAFLESGPRQAEQPLALSLDPLALIVSCILAEPALERARRSVQAFREAPLTLVLGHDIDPDELRGVSRSCIKRLQARPHSFSELERMHAGAKDEVTALVYALLLTGAVALRTGPSEYPRPMHASHVPRSISSHGMRAVGSDPAARNQAVASDAPEASDAPDAPHGTETLRPAKTPRAGGYSAAGESERAGAPRGPRTPRKQPWKASPSSVERHLGERAKASAADALPPASVVPPRSEGSAQAGRDRASVSQECEAEAKVVNAWMMGEADRSFLEKARVFSGKVVKLFPKNPRIRYCFACLEKRAGNYDAAIREFARVLELEPGNVDARNDLDQLMKWSKAQRRAENP
jgi:hypothetical protein